ncbi:zinc-binding dehydrogenase [Streptomyces sp. NBC_00199]|uniref:zinc-binding dehydrogenase n=1 Tax=Streptomyces sp. NBC_00199 TaxID=2975678 RepID=UPI002257FA95|nr:zinc-binding dehydrogenase [Streptomyces sp. NBC_00199]MCX5265128.1 zinc-binding dehydrogenase [Streptomyces sp. NBC_00199]
MHAIRLHAFGPAENLRHEEVDDPVPGPGQVRIAVEAAGVHLLDTALREGVPGPAPLPVVLPTVPGREVAGVVDALGEETPDTWLGRRVVAHLGFAPGGYAELAVTDVERLHEIPAGLDAAQAVAMIGTGRTALGIAQFADLGPHSVALVTAAAGGVGTLLVQHARNAGATVVGLAGGPHKTALVEAAGADLAVDYTDPAWPAEVRARLGARAVTVVFDGVGADAAREAVALLAPGGRHLVFGWSAEGIRDGRGHFVDGVSRPVLGPVMLERAGGLRALEQRALAEAAAGRLIPAVHPFPLTEAAAAHHALETRGTTGKVILIP